MNHFVLAAAGLLLVPATLVAAQDPAAGEPDDSFLAAYTEEDGWRFELTPQLWFAGVSGSVEDEGFDADVNGDMFGYDEMGLSGTTRLEAHHNQFGLFFSTTYTSFEDHHRVATAELKPDVKLFMLEAGASLVLIDWQLGPSPDQIMTVEALAGVRFGYMHHSFLTRPLGGSSVPLETNSGSETWVDPIIGGRVTWHVHEDIDLSLRGDIGGFDIGTEFSWQVVAGVRWWFRPNMALALDYKAIDIEYSSGDFRYDARIDGPALGLSFRF